MSLGTELAQGQCPYCGETIELVVDTSLIDQQYIEDCSVCCKPMVIQATDDTQDDIRISLRREDE